MCTSSRQQVRLMISPADTDRSKPRRLCHLHERLSTNVPSKSKMISFKVVSQSSFRANSYEQILTHHFRRDGGLGGMLGCWDLGDLMG
jgi:hypothetical protein